jgi:Asp/Glu/hydantoin racemase
VLVACFSAHPLVAWLTEQSGQFGRLLVTGIFEASILTAYSLIRPGKKWGIVTTGKYWEQHLLDGCRKFLGMDGGRSRFAGVETTGLNASDFHGGVDPEVVHQALKDAVARLLGDDQVECVIMGCAGMTGLEKIIRSTAAEMFSQRRADDLFVVDGVRAGVGLLEQMVRNKQAFQRPP